MQKKKDRRFSIIALNTFFCLSCKRNIFKDNINDEKLRFSTETDIINILNNILNLNILNNKKLHFKYGVHDLTFKEMYNQI